MKYDPDSNVRSQRENMQAFQLRLPKETIKDLQILRVFAGVKVSEELRDLIVGYVETKRPLIKQAAADSLGAPTELTTEEQVLAANALAKRGEVDLYHVVPVLNMTKNADGTVTRSEPADKTPRPAAKRK
ncbi:hypothetical protein [Burkholderia sp. S171]|uniref:hypothetical protein n=1 Tax=Burkholderia sp. S171 TaxID=1641860 RepID=UPI00131EB652|nr:hypothetical protein [Burkholderia sp. S171]